MGRGVPAVLAIEFHPLALAPVQRERLQTCKDGAVKSSSIAILIIKHLPLVKRIPAQLLIDSLYNLSLSLSSTTLCTYLDL